MGFGLSVRCCVISLIIESYGSCVAMSKFMFKRKNSVQCYSG